MKFKWKYCELCEKMYVECPKCGNNTCNACYGTDIMGNECDVCELAYQFEEIAYKAGLVPKIPKSLLKMIKGIDLEKVTVFDNKKGL